MRQSLAQAAVAVGRSRSTILRSIRAGKLSAERDEMTGAWSIDMAELARVFPATANGGQAEHGHGLADDQMRPGQLDTLATRLAVAEARLTDAQGQIADLRARLDEERADRRQAQTQLAAAQERIAALLTDQRTAPLAAPAAPARRSWWRWGRAGR
jgi:hypothetical protein